MKKCEYCDARMDDNDYYCPSCGKTNKQENEEVKKNAFFYRIFSFFMPLLGFIFFFLKRDTDSRLAKISVRSAILGIVFYFLSFALLVLFYFYIFVEIFT